MKTEQQPHIYLDRSGELRTDYFYTVEFDEFVSFPDKAAPGEVLVRRIPTEEELILKGRHCYFSVMFETSFDLKTEERKDCPVDPAHITQSWWKDLKVTADSDPKTAGVAAPFIRLNADEFALLIRDDLLEVLKKSGLTGWRAAEVIYATQGDAELGRSTKPRGYPKLWDFQFRGRARLRSLSVRNAPNVCPFCGHSRIVCPGCQYKVVVCDKCRNHPWTTRHIQMESKRIGREIPKATLLWEGVSQGIILGEHWDSSDFIQIGQGSDYGPHDGDSHIITKRALDWLLARHAMPLWARPIPVDISRMTDEQRRRLEMAKDVNSLKAT